MNDDEKKHARDMVQDAAVHDAEAAATFGEFKDMEKQMANLSNTILGTNRSAEGFISSIEGSAMMAVARELAKIDPETEVLLKELEKSEKQIAGLTDTLGSV